PICSGSSRSPPEAGRPLNLAEIRSSLVPLDAPSAPSPSPLPLPLASPSLSQSPSPSRFQSQLQSHSPSPVTPLAKLSACDVNVAVSPSPLDILAVGHPASSDSSPTNLILCRPLDNQPLQQYRPPPSSSSSYSSTSLSVEMTTATATALNSDCLEGQRLEQPSHQQTGQQVEDYSPSAVHVGSTSRGLLAFSCSCGVGCLSICRCLSPHSPNIMCSTLAHLPLDMGSNPALFIDSLSAWPTFRRLLVGTNRPSVRPSVRLLG
ncbi:unnamed protein product, partial [Protopolystoma xenopodis]